MVTKNKITANLCFFGQSSWFIIASSRNKKRQFRQNNPFWNNNNYLQSSLIIMVSLIHSNLSNKHLEIPRDAQTTERYSTTTTTSTTFVHQYIASPTSDTFPHRALYTGRAHSTPCSEYSPWLRESSHKEIWKWEGRSLCDCPHSRS